MSKHGIRLHVLIMVALLMAACAPRIRLPEDPGVGSAARYLVVRVPYCPLKAEPDAASADRGLLRRGEVRKIIESRFGVHENEARALWFRIEEHGIAGWIPISEVEVYQTLRQALAAAGRMQ